jgi:hypothetical protein
VARECTIEAHPNSIDALNNHPVEEYELVLSTRRPDGKAGETFVPKTFADRSEVNTKFMEGAAY